MKNRFQQMDEFIKKFASILAQNPDIELSDKELYNALYLCITRIGIDDDEVDLSSKDSGVFNRLEGYFEDRRNLKVIRDPKDDYFLQFFNGEDAIINNEGIKIYIPQTNAYIERSARVLFDFLDNFNITHASKIAREERNDNIVVRVINRNDAIKVINFASGNKQIKSGLIDPNPFTYSIDGIGVACDRGESYNSIIANLLKTYLNDKLLNRNFENCGLSDFVYFTEKYYDHHFANFRDVGEVVTDFDLKGCEVSNVTNNKRVGTVGNVIHLFLCGVDKNFNEENFYDQFNIRNNEGHIITQANNIGLKRNENDGYVNDYLGSIDTLLLDSVDYFKKKFNYDDSRAINDIVQRYLDDGNIAHITRDNDYRKKYIQSDFFRKMDRILATSHMNLEDYYKIKKKERSIKSIKDAIFETYLKYETRYEEGFSDKDGITQAVSALFTFVVSDRRDWFTRDNNARNNVINYSTLEDAKEEIAKSCNGQVDFNNPDDVYDKCYRYAKEVVNSRRIEHGNSFRLY